MQRSVGWGVLLLLAALGIGCQARATPAGPAAQGAALFNKYCVICHVVEPGVVSPAGPNLAGIANLAAANPRGLSAADYLREATLEPNAHLAPGYAPSMMPLDYATRLSPAEVDALVAYMLTL